MRRITILLGVLAALMLVPAASAFAETASVEIKGTGSGEVSSKNGLHAYSSFYPTVYTGEPPIECSYSSPGPQSGTCSNEMEDLEEGYVATALIAIPAPGSEFVGWTITGGQNGGDLFEGCHLNKSEGPAEKYTWCFPYTSAAENVHVTATFNTEPPPGPELKITKEGGEGTVVSNPAGIECGATCSTTHIEAGKVVTLTASPATGYMFSSWKGCNPGGAEGHKCTVTLSAAKTVVAKFIPSYTVSVSKAGSGLGKVSSSPGGVLCLATCTATKAAFKAEATVKLTAAPSKNYHLVKWTGDCSGSGACEFPAISANHTVGAEFAENSKFGLTVNKKGGGTGSVKSSVAGINCGTTCLSQTVNYYSPTELSLTATPAKGSVLKEWTGACSGNGTCTVTMSGAKTVGAKFE